MGLLFQIREQWAQFLATDVPSGAAAYFSPAPPLVKIPIFTEKLGSLENKINAGLQKTGLSVLLVTVMAKSVRNNIPGRFSLADAVAVARVYCTPMVNPSGISADECAEAVEWFTRGMKVKTPGCIPAPWQLLSIRMAPDPRKDRVGYDVIYKVDAETTLIPQRSPTFDNTKAPTFDSTGRTFDET